MSIDVRLEVEWLHYNNLIDLNVLQSRSIFISFKDDLHFFITTLTRKFLDFGKYDFGL